MDYLDKYAEQLRRQNLGYLCEYCQSASGHRVSCFLLSGTLTVTGPAFKEDKYRTLNPADTIEEALDAVNKYYRKGSPKVTKAVVPSEADHIALHGLGVKWEENV